MKKNNYEIKNTLGMFDFLKGCIMLIVMLSHTAGLFEFMDRCGGAPDVLVAQYGISFFILLVLVIILGQASMPLMFVLSGYGFRKTSFINCLKRQCKNLLIPYIVSMILVAVVKFISYYVYYGDYSYAVSETKFIFTQILLGYSTASPNWFLLSLIIGDLIFNQLLKVLHGKKLLITTGIVAIAGWGLSFMDPLPFSISQGFIATFYIAVGYFAKRKKLFTSSYTRAQIIGIVLGTLIFGIVEKSFGDDLNMASSVYSLGPATIIFNLILSLGFIYSFLLLNRFNNILFSTIRRIGRYSLYVLCIHTIEFKSVGQYIQGRFVETWQGSLALRTIIQFGVRSVVVIGATYIFVKLRHLQSRKCKKSIEAYLA